MNVLDFLLVLIAIPTVGAYICRLSQLTFEEHHPAIVLMHICLAISTSWAGIHAVHGAGMDDWSAVIGAASWICISYKTWRKGVPRHFSRQEEQEGHIVGKHYQERK